MRGEAFASYSADKIVDEEDADNYASEYLNTINLSSLPPHLLKFKVGAAVILYAISAHQQDYATECAFVLYGLVKESSNAKSLLVNMQAINMVFIPRIPLA